MCTRPVMGVAVVAFVGLLALSMLMPSAKYTSFSYAQQPTATAECLGECRALRFQSVWMDDATTFNVKGEWPGIAFPCVKSNTEINEDSRHAVAVVGLRDTGGANSNHRVEIGWIKATWGGGDKPYLYTYCSWCASGQFRYKFHKIYYQVTPRVDFRIEIDNSGATKKVRWYYTDNADGPGTPQEVLLREWPENLGTNTVSFSPYGFFSGGYSTDTRNELGLHLNQNVEYKIGTGSYTDMSPSPSQPWKGYYGDSGVYRYYTHFFNTDKLEVSTDVQYGIGENLCP